MRDDAVGRGRVDRGLTRAAAAFEVGAHTSGNRLLAIGHEPADLGAGMADLDREVQKLNLDVCHLSVDVLRPRRRLAPPCCTMEGGSPEGGNASYRTRPHPLRIASRGAQLVGSETAVDIRGRVAAKTSHPG